MIEEAIACHWEYRSTRLTFYKYQPWFKYKGCEEAQKNYQETLRMPELCWPKVIEWVERAQSPEDRDRLYEFYKGNYTKERNWYTNKRQHGILSFVLPTHYGREKAYPRVQPRFHDRGGLGLVGCHKDFRRAVLGHLNRSLFTEFGYKIYELDLRSCHLEILAGLRLETPQLEGALTSLYTR
jgi:hypothetical protein